MTFLKRLFAPILLVAPLLVMLQLAAVQAASAQTYMLMAEEDGCFWCERWNKEIGHIYPKTAEGKTAPLKRYDLHSETPNIDFKQRVHYTPTFILVRNNKEIGRIEGYPGEDHFWALLGMLFEKTQIPLDVKG